MFRPGNTASDLSYILPILMVCVTACIVLLGDVFLWPQKKDLNPIVSLLGLAVTGWFLYSGHDLEEVYAFADSLKVDSLFMASSAALLVTGALSVLMAWSYLKNRGLNHGEYYVLLLFSIFGAMLMAVAQDLIVLFLGL